MARGTVGSQTVGSKTVGSQAGEWVFRSEIGGARNCRVPDCRVPDCRVPVGKWGIRSEIGGLRNCRVPDCRVPDCRIPVKKWKKNKSIYIYTKTNLRLVFAAASGGSPFATQAVAKEGNALQSGFRQDLTKPV